MKQILTIIFTVIYITNFAQSIESYQSLDSKNPIVFNGDYIIYKNKKIKLGSHALFIDGQLTDTQADKSPYVYNSFNEATANLTNGTEQNPMVLYIAPYVYWIDDPDAPEIRGKEQGATPYGLQIKCQWLRFYGLSEDASNVVLACNRGQTMGAIGNFTLFNIDGDGTSAENITFGNYCNVDLVFPLKPELNREKRGSAIVQAQLVHCNGDKIVIRNTRFISRLNLCPFTGAKRILFDHCHFESTDDALCGSGVYVNCTFEFFSSKPFYCAMGTGAVFLNCDIHSMCRKRQNFSKAHGQFAIIDTRINSNFSPYLSWRDTPPSNIRNYQYNVEMDNKSVLIATENPQITIDMQDKDILNAYRIEIDGKTIYNTYNLLKGNDDWDPDGIKNKVIAAEKTDGKKYTNLPTLMTVEPDVTTIETGKDSVTLSTKLFRFGNYPYSSDKKITWHVDKSQKNLVQLKPSENGSSCLVIPKNNNNETKDVIIIATLPSGIEAAGTITVMPQILDAPEFVELPTIEAKNGKLHVNYSLDSSFEDWSDVSWYRCTDNRGNNPIEVAVSRFNEPLLNYKLTDGDIGYYIMVSVAPRHIRCNAGTPRTCITEQPIKSEDIKTNPFELHTTFRNVSVKNQLETKPGFWTFRPFDTNNISSTKDDSWYYGEGQQGHANMFGLLQSARTATMFYTPTGNQYSDMTMRIVVSPYKTAGQGFSVAPLYMDVLIKFDTKNETGYALRFQRTTKYGNAVDCYFVKYEKGKTSQISKAISTSCFRSPCTIELVAKNTTLTAHVSTSANYYINPEQSELLTEVNISTSIKPNKFGGFGIEYNGGASTMINSIDVSWEK